MTSKKQERERRERQTVADITEQLANLSKMSIDQLKEMYLELYGVSTRNRNKPYLKKKLAWRIQELAEGGLSEHAKGQIEALAPDTPMRWRASKGAKRKNEPATTQESAPRDPSLPPPGTVLSREHKGIEHKVTVLDNGFEYQGARYRSLSKIATLITGTRWNGFLFFRLKQRAQTSMTGAAR